MDRGYRPGAARDGSSARERSGNPDRDTVVLAVRTRSGRSLSHSAGRGVRARGCGVGWPRRRRGGRRFGRYPAHPVERRGGLGNRGLQCHGVRARGPQPIPGVIARVARNADREPFRVDVDDPAFTPGSTAGGVGDGHTGGTQTAASDRSVDRVDTPVAARTPGLVTGSFEKNAARRT